MIRPIVTLPDPVLRGVAEPFDLTRIADLQELVRDLIDTCSRASGLGLAAPQVGVPVRVFVIRAVPELHVPDLVVVNPTIQTFGRCETAPEGCLSIPDKQFLVRRAPHTILRAFDADGTPFQHQLEDLAARVVQHEYDHLDGKLICDVGTEWISDPR